MKMLSRMHIVGPSCILSLLAAIVLVGASTVGNASLTVNYGKARLVIHNDTGVPIHYMLRWGASSDWNNRTVQNGTYRWHTYNLDSNDRAPAPYIRFHNAVGNYTEYKLRFGKFSEGRIDNSTHYSFKFTGGVLDLYKQ